MQTHLAIQGTLPGKKKREMEDKKSTPQMGLFGQNKMYTN